MFDFRYHALSLVAVFVALLLGLLLGVAIGDSGLVSSAERDIRASLRRDVNRANDRVDSVQQQLDRSRRFEREVYPLLIGGQLEGAKIGLVFLGNGSQDIADDVKASLEGTGASLVNVARVREPLSLTALAGRAGTSRYAALDDGPAPDLDLVEDFGFRMAAQYVVPGKLIAAERGEVFSSFNGDLVPLDGIVLVRNQPDKLGSSDEKVADRFEIGFANGLRATRRPVAGAERADTDPSQIGWYEDRNLSSSDDIDATAGRAALIFVLTGAEGSFGTKSTADDLLPDIARGATAP